MTTTTTMTTEQEHHTQAMGPYLVCENPPHYLSAVDFGDVPEMVRVLNINKDICEGTASFQYPYLESHAQDRIARTRDDAAKRGFNTRWAMRTSPDGPLMGWIHIHFDPDVKKVHPTTDKPLLIAHLGYWVSPEYMHKGYASRSARFMTHEICFKELDCDIVCAEAYIANQPSRRIMEYCGMECEVEQESSFIPKLQEYRIICRYAVHRDDSTKGITST